MANCPKCSGTGYINCYSHVARGVCFLCNGSGKVADKPERKQRTPKVLTPEEKRAKADAKLVKLITGTISDAEQHVARTHDISTFILATFAAERTSVHDLGSARIYAEHLYSAVYQFNKARLAAC